MMMMMMMRMMMGIEPVDCNKFLRLMEVKEEDVRALEEENHHNDY